VRGKGLADRAYIVLFAFYGEQRGTPDGARLHFSVLIGKPAQWQSVFLKNEPDGLQIELGRQIENGEILVVKRFSLSRLCGVTIRKVFVQLVMRL